MHFRAPLLLSFVSALNSQKHVKLNNKKIKSVTYPEFFISEIYLLFKKSSSCVFSPQNFDLSGLRQSKIDAF